MNKIPFKKSTSPKNIKSLGQIAYKEYRLQKQLNINSFNIIELNEEEITPENDPELSMLSLREIKNLKDKASLVEEYYSKDSEDENANINENCFHCLMSNFKPNELLYFNNRKSLLSYLKYCFYFLKKIIFMDYQIYIENKYDLDKCNTHYLVGWKFFIPKTVCKACFLEIINMEHLFGNLKNIFCDVDAYKIIQNGHRNRISLNSKLRKSRSTHRNHSNKINEKNDIETKGKKKKLLYKKGTKIRIRNFGYSKENLNSFYDDKNGLLTNKKDTIQGANSINRKEGNGIDIELKNNLNKNVNGQIDGKSVTEIKIETNEFLGEINLLKNKNNENKSISMDESGQNKIKASNKNGKSWNNKNINSHSDINNNLLNISNNNFITQKTTEISNDNSKNKITMNIYSEILNSKSMSNKIVMKLDYKLKCLKEILIYLIINVGDFRDKLYNTMNNNPSFIPFGVSLFEFYFDYLYNEIFKAKKEYEEIFMKIKKQSIPSIEKGILLLKEKEQLVDDEKKNLDDLANSLKDFIPKINLLEEKYEIAMKNVFEYFKYFLSLMSDFKNAFG
jgi:hypothetical protein